VPQFTRRRAIEIAGAAAAVAGLQPPAALAGRSASFSADLGSALPRGATAAGAVHVLPVMRAPRRFDLIGLDFGPAARVHAEVRARRRGGAWSAWTPLHAATQPCWTGPADVFQVRFAGAVRQLRARFVRVGRVAPRAGAAARKAKSGPPILGREVWGGDRLPPKADPIFGEVQVGFVHHTATANDYGAGDSASIVRGICRYHRDHNGWNDIGYNFLVDRYGQIFEGREGGIDQAVVGAQAQGYNSSSTGVSCIGDHTTSGLSAKAFEAVARLLAYKLALHGVPVTGSVGVVSQGGASNRYRSGTRVRLQRICGHRDGDSTTCPGDALYRRLGALRARAEELAVAVPALTVLATETELRHPATVGLSGMLRFADGASPLAAAVQIQYQTWAGSAWELVHTLQADADGAFAASVAVPASGRVRAVFAGDGTHAPITATPIPITVVARLTLSLDPRRLRPGRSTAVSATIDPPGAATARLIVERRVGTRYLLVQRRSVTVSGGAVATSFKPSRTGLYRVTLQAGGATIRRLVRVSA